MAIHDWLNDDKQDRNIFYLLDVAGSGKSTVAKQISADLASKQKEVEKALMDIQLEKPSKRTQPETLPRPEMFLLARYFFSRDSEETMGIDSFCVTVAGGFSGHSIKFKDYVDEFRRKYDHGNLSFEETLEGMVIEPLKLFQQPAVLIIDAVDECNNDYEGRDRLLNALHAHRSAIPNLRILITGRLENDIATRAKKDCGFKTFRQLEGPNKDVERYIHARLEEYLSEEKRKVVIRAADGLFIWAKMACDLLIKSVSRDELLEELAREVSLVDLYKVAMREAMPRDKPSQRAISSLLALILAAQRPLSIAELEKLSQQPEIVAPATSCLGSLLVYEGREDPIRLLHITFRDFILDHSKSGPYFVQVKLGHYILASQSVELLVKIIGSSTEDVNYTLLGHDGDSVK